MADREVTDALFWMLHGDGRGQLAVSSAYGRHWLPVDHVGRWRRLVDGLAYDGDLSVSLLPWEERRFRWPAHGGVLWARVESKASGLKLDRFGVKPALVVREGSTARRMAVWPLVRPLALDWVERGNRRLAHHLGTPKKWCGATGELPVPGTVLREGRKRPVPVVVERFEPQVFSARQVVGALRDAPDPTAWMDRVA